MGVLDDRLTTRRFEDRSPPRRVMPLGGDEILVETAWGGHLVVPGFNIDVAIGVMRDGVHEPWTTRLVQLLLRPGDICLHGGAGFGYFACLAGQRVGAAGRVVAAEPNPHLLPYLLKSLHWNGSHGHTEVFGRALSDEEGRDIACRFDPQRLATLPPRCPPADGPSEPALPEDGRWSAATMGRLLDAEGRWGRTIGLAVPFTARTTTIDAIANLLALPRIDLLHLDLGGAEPLALRGARRVITASPDCRILTRWSAAHHARLGERRRAAFEEVWDFLTGLGYAVRMLEPLIDRDGGLQLSPPLTHEVMTTLALPGLYLWSRCDDDLT